MTRRGLILAAPAALWAATPLDRRIRRAVDRASGKVSLFARNLSTGAAYGLGENDRVRTASTIKLPIMAAVFALAKAGQVSWDEELTLTPDLTVSGSGVLREFTPGSKIRLRDLVHLMIVISDNTATNMILERISADRVNDEMDQLGLANTRSIRKVRGDGTDLKAPQGWSKFGRIEENQRFGIGVSTTREMVMLLEKLHRGEVVSPEASAEMIAILKRQHYKDGIGRRFRSAQVASKSGSLDALRSDVGIVYGPGEPVAIAITVDGMKATDWSADNPGLRTIAELSEALVEGLTA